ncbi:MAG: ABC transporter substrate-binding protein [Alphaproteobacteria bacterium]
MKRHATYAAAVVGLLALVGSGPIQAQESLTIVSYGGAYQDSQREAFFKPFSEESEVAINEVSWSGEVAKIRAMVETGNVEWDVIDVEKAEFTFLCEEGLLEEIDYEALGGQDRFYEDAVSPCGVGAIFWGTIWAYDKDVVNNPPKTWAEFWDVEKFPGPRALRRSPKSTLEFALMADGVPVDEVYDVLSTDEGVERAFSKLDEIKPHIKVWWTAGAQPPQLLTDGEVTYTTAYNGRIYNAIVKEGKNFEMMWDQHLAELDYWAIPKGTPKKDLAMEFLAFATSAERQGDQTNYINYSPTAKDASPFINSAVLPYLPTAPENFKNALVVDIEFWIENLEVLTEDFEAWLAR